MITIPLIQSSYKTINNRTQNKPVIKVHKQGHISFSATAPSQAVQKKICRTETNSNFTFILNVVSEFIPGLTPSEKTDNALKTEITKHKKEIYAALEKFTPEEEEYKKIVCDILFPNGKFPLVNKLEDKYGGKNPFKRKRIAAAKLFHEKLQQDKTQIVKKQNVLTRAKSKTAQIIVTLDKIFPQAYLKTVRTEEDLLKKLNEKDNLGIYRKDVLLGALDDFPVDETSQKRKFAVLYFLNKNINPKMNSAFNLMNDADYKYKRDRGFEQIKDLLDNLKNQQNPKA